MPFQGALLIARVPRAMPWAKSFCPFRACCEKLANCLSGHYFLSLFLNRFSSFLTPAFRPKTRKR